MDIIEIIKSRRSIRKFRDEKIPPELVEKILEAGRWAPSGMNNQPWRFAVIEGQAMIDTFSKLTHYGKIVKSARLLIPVFLDNSAGYNRTKDVQAVGACLQNMLMEIHSAGLGAVWLGEILKSGDQIREVLGLDENLELMAVLAVGYPDEQPRVPERKSLKDLVVFRG